ncbi:hypothetical protein PZU33_33600, partial [Pseudomonas aeruginosa]|uniref:hypothetical protein n=2 Tax=Pseudomonas aeruginosa TaxID=287 RepID=UPI002B273A59
MTKANECTCPSGDGSLRHPCPAHPALVEQAGGDERAAFRPAQVISYRPGVGEVTIYVAGRVPGYMNIGDTVYVSDRAPVEQPIAALAQPSLMPPDRGPWHAVKWDGGRRVDLSSDDFEHDVALTVSGDFVEGDKFRYAQELAAWMNAHLAQPSPAQAEKAEVERPEVVATMYTHHDDVDFRELVVAGNCDKDCEGFYGPEKLMTVAQHERITAQLHDALDESDGDRWKLRSERDAALARVSEL